MADEADLAAIRSWVASGGQIGVDKAGNPVVPANVVEPDNAPPAPAPTTPDTTPGGLSADQARAQREADRQADREARQQRQQQQEQQQRRKRTAGLLGRISDGLGEWAANVPTPGGNLALVLILIFFAFAIIPVNSGRTRLQLIWDVLTGNAELPGQGSASGPTAGQSGIGGTIGGIAGGIGTGIGIGLAPVLGGLSATSSGSGGGGNPSNIPDPAAQSGSGPVIVNPLALLEAPRGGEW